MPEDFEIYTDSRCRGWNTLTPNSSSPFLYIHFIHYISVRNIEVLLYIVYIHLPSFKQELKHWHGQNFFSFLAYYFLSNNSEILKNTLAMINYKIFEMHRFMVFKVFSSMSIIWIQSLTNTCILNPQNANDVWMNLIKKNNMVITPHLKSKKQHYGNRILFENYDIDWLFFMVIYISKVDSDLTPIRTILEVYQHKWNQSI